MSKDDNGGKDLFGHKFDHYDEENNYLKKIPMTTLTMVVSVYYEKCLLTKPHLLVNFVVYDETE